MNASMSYGSDGQASGLCLVLPHAPIVDNPEASKPLPFSAIPERNPKANSRILIGDTYQVLKSLGHESNGTCFITKKNGGQELLVVKLFDQDERLANITEFKEIEAQPENGHSSVLKLEGNLWD
ncbi:hypothetical protein BGX23_011664 [Mortierella sp. AD031]|nr:hypothetical protein BGX23_011664 [Mortierella sp. AD031]